MNIAITESPDLAGVIVGETAISDVQGEAGYLSYRGIDITELAQQPFLQVVWQVLFGQWPDPAQEQQLRDHLAINSTLQPEDLALLRALPAGLHPMRMLQGIIPLIQPATATDATHNPDADLGLAIAARLPSLIAAHHRLSQGLDPIPAALELSLHENFLVMLHGNAPSPEAVRLLDTTQILQLEHSFNAGTFAGRVCASTKAALPAVLSASVGTLSGPLHGGADQAALAMAREVGSPEAAAEWVAAALARGDKIMGMGHREYRRLDPRAAILKPLAREFCTEPESRNLFATLVAIEEACQAHFGARGQEIHANVEFYKGAVFHSLGIPDHYFTALFAMARVYGYLAHYLEFAPVGRLIRPRARYIGE